MTATKNINVFQRYVSWILDKLMNNIFDELGFEDSPYWNIVVEYHRNDFELHRQETIPALNDIIINPAYTECITTRVYTPNVLALRTVSHNFKDDYFFMRVNDIQKLHMTPWQAVELCKALLFETINTYDNHAINYEQFAERNIRFFALLAYQYSNTALEPELYDRAKRLVKSLHNRYQEINTL